VSVTADHDTFTCEHDTAPMLVIDGIGGAVPSTGAQLTGTETTFESRVTEVVARIAKSNEVLFDTDTVVERTPPNGEPADHEFCFAVVNFDIT
jgi:hypothetical protein